MAFKHSIKYGSSVQILEYTEHKRVQTQNVPRTWSIVHAVKEQHYITVNKCEEQGEGRFTHIVTKLKWTEHKWTQISAA